MKVILDGFRRLRYRKTVEITEDEYKKLIGMDEYDMAVFFEERMHARDVIDDDVFEDMDVTTVKDQ